MVFVTIFQRAGFFDSLRTALAAVLFRARLLDTSYTSYKKLTELPLFQLGGFGVHGCIALVA